MNKTHPSLLPNGLQDLLPHEAEKEAAAIHRFMAEFSSFGYQRVKPPLVEFETSLLGEGPGQALVRNTFRLMDPVSQEMMGVRADVTSQIARIAGSRLAQEDRPLRLSYAADVLRVNGTQLRPERQFCQVGCELIGWESAEADIEISLLALRALSEIGLKDLSIDLTLPTLVQHIFTELGCNADDQERIRSLIEKRDHDGLIQEGSAASQLLANLLESVAPASQALESLKSTELPSCVQSDLETLETVYSGLDKALKAYGLEDINITIDPLEQRGFEYKTGVSFTLFSKGVRGELGRGGRYLLSGEAGEKATGFTFYMDTVCRALSDDNQEKQKIVSADTKWDEIRKLQEQGYNVIRKDS